MDASNLSCSGKKPVEMTHEHCSGADSLREQVMGMFLLNVLVLRLILEEGEV
jgi:hypothetical protein